MVQSWRYCSVKYGIKSLAYLGKTISSTKDNSRDVKTCIGIDFPTL